MSSLRLFCKPIYIQTAVLFLKQLLAQDLYKFNIFFFFLAPYSSHNPGPDPWDVGIGLPGKLNPAQKIVPSEMLFGQSLLELIGQKKIDLSLKPINLYLMKKPKEETPKERI